MTVSADRRYVVAADAGGTHTRVACFGLDGTLLSTASGRGGAWFHNADAAQNTAETTARCIESGGLDPRNAVHLAAGLSNISRPGSNQGDGDNEWASDYFVVPGPECRRTIVNDAVAAHRGALLCGPGVVVIAGTGSMILAITDDGTEVESGQFEHYAGAARHLVFEAMQLIFTGAGTEQDADFIHTVLEYWGAADVADLRTVILALCADDPMETRHRYGRLAPAVTAAAGSSPIADRAVRDLAGKTARGIRLLAPLFTTRTRVALCGSVATTRAFTERLTDALHEDPAAEAFIVPTKLDAVRGAALIAYRQLGLQITDSRVRRLGMDASS